MKLLSNPDKIPKTLKILSLDGKTKKILQEKSVSSSLPESLVWLPELNVGIGSHEVSKGSDFYAVLFCVESVHAFLVKVQDIQRLQGCPRWCPKWTKETVEKCFENECMLKPTLALYWQNERRRRPSGTSHLSRKGLCQPYPHGFRYAQRKP